MRHLLHLNDLSPEEINQVFAISSDLKTKLAAGVREPLLAGKVLVLLFEKPSLRTRVSFDAGMTHLGGNALYLGTDGGWQTRESNADFARVVSQYADAIVARTFDHQTIAELAQYSVCPVINGLSDRSHPCQALADLLTLQERFGKLEGLKVAFLGDGNNVARSLAVGCGKLGIEFALGCPQGYEFDQAFGDLVARDLPDMKLTVTHDPAEAVAGADCIYTDVWTSMGQEAERAKRLKDFASYQVNAALMKQAGKDAVFMHCLPAHRGEEVTDEVIDGPQSIVIEEAANRMHAQKGLLVWLLQGTGG